MHTMLPPMRVARHSERERGTGRKRKGRIGSEREGWRGERERSNGGLIHIVREGSFIHVSVPHDVVFREGGEE